MTRWVLMASAVAIAIVGPWVFAGVDEALASSGWFPHRNNGPSLEGVAFTILFAASLSTQGPRRIIAMTTGFFIALLGLWGIRYLLGLTGASVDPKMVIIVHWIWMLAAAGVGGWMARMEIRRGRDWLIQAMLIVGATIVADSLVGALGIDWAVINKVLYYQTVEIEVHEPVADPQRLYGLKPNSSLGGEGPWGLRIVRVNSHGARTPEYPAQRIEGRERTLIFGGSTLYGAGVSNGDTTPGAMDRMVGPNHEVWNFGVCAYNTAQSVALAMTTIESLSPDRIIIMITNTGRRAFMGGPEHHNSDKRHYFDQNPFLYLENFPPNTGQSEQVHALGLQYSALYRTLVGWARSKQNPGTEYADQADRRAVANLEAKALEHSVEVLYVLSPSRGSEIGPDDMGVPPDRWLDLNQPGRGGEYQQAHPPPQVLTEYATSIVRWLKRRHVSGVE